MIGEEPSALQKAIGRHRLDISSGRKDKMVSTEVHPASLVAAALIMQFGLILIATLGALAVRRMERAMYRFYDDPPNVGRFAWLLLSLALVTVGLLVFSDEFSTLGSPAFAGLKISIIGWSNAIRLVVLLDILCFSILVAATGGSYQSPFTPVCLMIPALAIFLRENPARVIFYALLVAIAFGLNLAFADRGSRARVPHLGAYWLVSTLCLALTTFIGIITRPR